LVSSDGWARELRSHYRDDRNLARRQSLFSYVKSTTGSVEDVIAPIVESGLVLDIGCGNGLWPARLVQRDSRAIFVGADTSEGMVQLARRQPGTIAVAQADICAMPFADSVFDVVLALWMLYHVNDKAAALGELERVKRPTGYLVAVTNSGDDTPLNALIASALSTTLDRNVDSFLPPLDFTSENGAEILRSHFDEVHQIDWETRFEIPVPDPIIDYVGSINEAIELKLGEVDWAATNDCLTLEANREIQRAGHIRHHLRQSAFIAR
jgi:SAM-dependent methyltransferase